MMSGGGEDNDRQIDRQTEIYKRDRKRETADMETKTERDRVY